MLKIGQQIFAYASDYDEWRQETIRGFEDDIIHTDSYNEYVANEVFTLDHVETILNTMAGRAWIDQEFRTKYSVSPQEEYE